MTVHTTNYFNSFIIVADDCPATAGDIPANKTDAKTIAGIQYELLWKHPYEYSSDDLLFEVFALRNHLSRSERKEAREIFFSKGQPCMRASPLTKRYGWGVHHDAAGKIAIFGCETALYKKFLADKSLTILKAMRSSKAK